MKILDNIFQLKELLNYVTEQNDVKKSIILESLLLTEIEFYPCGNDYFVDQWPKPNVVIIYQKGNERNNCYLHSFGTSDVKAFIEEFHNMNFNPDDPYEMIMLADINNTVREVMKEKGVNMEVYTNNAAYVYQLDETSIKDKSDRGIAANKFCLPEGFHKSTLLVDDVQEVVQKWEFAAKNSKSLIKFMIECLPNVAIRDDSGNLVAYELQYPFGALGILYVNPEQRRQGLARYVTMEMAKNMFKKQKKAFVTIHVDNQISVNFHEKLGFQKTEKVFFNGL